MTDTTDILVKYQFHIQIAEEDVRDGDANPWERVVAALAAEVRALRERLALQEADATRLWTDEECDKLAAELTTAEPAYIWSAGQRIHDFFDHDDDSIWIRCRNCDLVMLSYWEERTLRTRTPELVQGIADAFRRQIVAARVVRSVEKA